MTRERLSEVEQQLCIPQRAAWQAVTLAMVSIAASETEYQLVSGSGAGSVPVS